MATQTKHKVTESDGITGITIERDPTDEEIAQMKIDSAARIVGLQKAEAQILAKQSAIAKLTALGLTEDEAKAIIG